MSDYDKILTFHDYIIDNTVYDSAAADDPYNEIYKDSFNAYGLLFNNTAVCQGYADMMAIFLDRYKIPNIKVSSNTHTWNLVYLNGSWKHLDATWDDPVPTNGINYKFYTYFLITTSELHEFDKGNAHTYVLENYLEAN